MKLTTHIFLSIFCLFIISNQVNAITDTTRIYKYNLTAPEFYIDDSTPEFTSIDQLKAASFLNECINTLARIERSESQIVLEEELDRLTNVLGWKDATDYTSIVNFRKELQDNLNSLIINSINKERYIKKYEKRQNRAAKDAFLNAISGVQINVNWTSVVSNVLISSARAYMDYNKRKEELGSELDEELWKLEIEQRNDISVLRQNLMDVYNEAYSEYNLENDMSLTIGEINEFYNILEKSDKHIKVQGLVDKVETLRYFTPYWFERGCAYIDLYEDEIKHGVNDKTNLDKAWESFNQYEKLYNQCILYRYDYRTGMIALYKLKYLDGITLEQKGELIDTVLKNIKNDGNALLYIALEYIESFNNIENGFNIMRKVIMDAKTSAHNEIILAAAAYWDRLNDRTIKDLFIRAIYDTNDIDIDAYIAFLTKIEQDRDVDSYPIKLKLQTNISLIPHKMDKDNDIWNQLTLNCNRDKFWFDNLNWPLILEMRNTDNRYTCYEHNMLPENFDKKYFLSIDDAYTHLKRNVKYFNEHPLDIDRATPFSHIIIGNYKYYYLSKEFNDIKPFCSYIDIPSDGEHIKKYDRTQEIENEYTDFCKKYLIKNVKYQYYLTDNSYTQEKCMFNSTKYTYKVAIPYQGDNKNQRYNIYLCFQSDYLNEDEPLLYFSGIIFNDEYIRF